MEPESCPLLDGAHTTHFVNRLIAFRTAGPCVQVFLAMAPDGAVPMFPDLCLVCPRDFALTTAMQAIDFLRATVAPPLVPAYSRLMS